MRTVPALVAGGLAAGVAAELATQAAKAREIVALRDRCRSAGAIVLSFDDGPGQRITPALLDLLREHGAHASFFPLGRRAVLAPELLDRARAEGHELGTHSFAHRHAWRVAPWTARRDIAAGFSALERWVPADGAFRPPHGKQTSLTRLAVRGAHTAWWTVDGGDTHAVLPDPAHAARAIAADGGGVVLLHDHDEERPAERLRFVLEATERLLAAARDRRLTVRRLCDL